MNLVKKEIEIFELIVKFYINTGMPVGSVNLIKKFNLNVSSATIRNIMASLEKKNMIEKSHISSGRIPSTLGLKYYAEFLADTPDEILLNKIKDIFSKRRINIDETIDEAAKLISEISGLTLITSDNSDINDILLKSISLTQINKNESIVVLITSSGDVFNKTIALNDSMKINDLKVAIRLFQERLIDSKLRELKTKTKILIPLLKKQIKNCDEIIEAFVNNVFYFNQEHNQKVYGKNFIIKTEDIERDKLNEIIELIENKSIWESIEEFSSKDEKMKIEIQDSNISLMSKRISVGNKSKDISIIGTKRMDYSTAKNVLNIIEDLLKTK
ncbi:MAG: heat-inducible transcriptional repressor HrcA [Metamycoplasmataceae bacterium]